VYRDPVSPGSSKVTVLSTDSGYRWSGLEDDLNKAYARRVTMSVRANHAVLVVEDSADAVCSWLQHNHPELRITSSGRGIEIYKERGLPAAFLEKFAVTEFVGSHALGHTRMATESAVTTEHSHPFSTGEDLCLVHNGSLSNHNRLRRTLTARGIVFETDNDSEVAAGYLTWRLREGDTLEEALRNALSDLDGFYTFAVGTGDGFAVLRDPIGCKPAVMAETEDWAAMASEFRSLATLPGIENARIWEPEPARIYIWSRG
jgi:glutamate synthase domain-containing protein 1